MSPAPMIHARQPDTGWRIIFRSPTVYEPSWTPGTMPSAGRLRVRRVGDLLWVSADDIQFSTAGGFALLGGLPGTWRVSGDSGMYPGAFYQIGSSTPFRVDRSDLYGAVTVGTRIRDVRPFPASGWPTTYPGVPG